MKIEKQIKQLLILWASPLILGFAALFGYLYLRNIIFAFLGVIALLYGIYSTIRGIFVAFRGFIKPPDWLAKGKSRIYRMCMVVFISLFLLNVLIGLIVDLIGYESLFDRHVIVSNNSDLVIDTLIITSGPIRRIRLNVDRNDEVNIWLGGGTGDGWAEPSSVIYHTKSKSDSIINITSDVNIIITKKLEFEINKMSRLYFP